jgi:hypothetical protein
MFSPYRYFWMKNFLKCSKIIKSVFFLFAVHHVISKGTWSNFLTKMMIWEFEKRGCLFFEWVLVRFRVDTNSIKTKLKFFDKVSCSVNQYNHRGV